MTTASRTASRTTAVHLGVIGAFTALAVLAGLARGTLSIVDGPLSGLVRGTSLATEFRDVSLLGGTEAAVILTILVVALLWRRCRPLALLYPAAVVAGAALNVVLKVVIARPRPSAPETATALASFPSGHTFQATIVLGLLPIVARISFDRPWLTRGTRVVAVVGIVAVALSRVYLGAHWTTDVVGGALVGAAVVLLVHRVIHRLDHPRCAHRAISAPRTPTLTVRVGELIGGGEEVADVRSSA